MLYLCYTFKVIRFNRLLKNCLSLTEKEHCSICFVSVSFLVSKSSTEQTRAEPPWLAIKASLVLRGWLVNTRVWMCRKLGWMGRGSGGRNCKERKHMVTFMKRKLKPTQSQK